MREMSGVPSLFIYSLVIRKKEGVKTSGLVLDDKLSENYKKTHIKMLSGNNCVM